MNKRIAPLLAIYLVVILLVFLILTAFTNNQYFSEILAFSSAIIGSVVGYYFSNRKAT
ncbi:cytochrome c maturation protein CcmE [Vibrio parahaemolyticus]|nr:cytochrome c maturation protein CcmE [Vibrio parahaemolyticus]